MGKRRGDRGRRRGKQQNNNGGVERGERQYNIGSQQIIKSNVDPPENYRHCGYHITDAASTDPPDNTNNYSYSEESDEEEETYTQQHTQQKHNIYPQQHTHEDHTFTQFHIQPLQQNNTYDDASQSSSSSSSSEDSEDAPLFASSNFSSATDNYTNEHIKGVEYGVDYLESRAERKEQERRHQFEIEQQRELERRSKWCWEDDDDDEWQDDVDFDSNYHQQTIFNKCRRRRKGKKFMFIFAIIVASSIAYHHQRSKFNTSSMSNEDDIEGEEYIGTTPSSRWGNRNNDNFKFDNTTAKEKEEELEKWEDYETEVANVLADASADWDIYKSGGGRKDDDTDNDDASDEYKDHWIQYFDKASQGYYYYHRESNTTQWKKPEIVEGTVLLGITYGTGSEYVVESNSINKEEESLTEESADTDISATLEVEEEDSDFNADQVLDHYSETFWRWNHPYRTGSENSEWGGVDTPVYFRIPLSGGTTMEQIMTKCYGAIVAGTTGSSKDGQEVLSRNISDHLSIITLDDGTHYLNIDVATKGGIEIAKKAGLGSSGVADVIMTRYLYNAATLFEETGHTGRCFTVLRHPVDRAIAVFHSLKRNNVKAVADMSLHQYAESNLSEDNWMVRMITNTMNEKLTQHHLQVAKEVIGRKCLVGFIDNNKFEETMERYTKFFRWEHVHSINTHHIVGTTATDTGIDEKQACATKLIKTGVNRHQYERVDGKSEAWQLLKARNLLDLELYNYAEALYVKQAIVYEEMERYRLKR